MEANSRMYFTHKYVSLDTEEKTIYLTVRLLHYHYYLLLSAGVNDSKIETIPLWIGPSTFDGGFSLKYLDGWNLERSEQENRRIRKGKGNDFVSFCCNSMCTFHVFEMRRVQKNQTKIKSLIKSG